MAADSLRVDAVNVQSEVKELEAKTREVAEMLALSTARADTFTATIFALNLINDPSNDHHRADTAPPGTPAAPSSRSRPEERWPDLVPYLATLVNDPNIELKRGVADTPGRHRRRKRPAPAPVPQQGH